MVCIIDLGISNIKSISNMLWSIDVENVITNEKMVIEKYNNFILPGVGSFDTGMKKLQDLDLIDILLKKAKVEKSKILGICLGAQMLLESSEEGIKKGLGLIPGKSRSFRAKFEEQNINLRLPNMGWRETNSNFKFQDKKVKRFYFVHSYFFELPGILEEKIEAEYGFKFYCGFKNENILGVQFHPEKSHFYGKTFFKNLYSAKP
jgi:glutamine amidotransferase